MHNLLQCHTSRWKQFLGILWIVSISLVFASGQPEFSVLARPLLATKPTIAISTPGEVMVGESFTFEVTIGPNASTTGYGPIIDVVFPVVGAGGDPLNPNGFDFVSASYLGSAIECSSVEFKLSSGTIQAKHPYAKDKNGNKLVLTHSTAGDKLVSCKLPFGSFVPSQPDAKVTFTAKQLGPPDPAVGVSLPLYARAGFMFGEDPLDNWCCDEVEPTLTHSNNVPGWTSGSVTPVVITTNKSFTPAFGSEYETATGPNFVNTYTITVDVANGKTVTGLQITDTLDSRIQFISVASPSPAGTCSTLPSTTAPGGTLVCDLGSVTGGSGSSDASVTFSFYIPENDAGGSDILTSGVGGCAGKIPNTISVTGTAGGGSQTVSDTVAEDHEFYACAVASQKDKTIVNDVAPTGVSPGDTVKYTIKFQVSDYFVFAKDDPATTTKYEGLIIEDTFTDGQRYDSTYIPELNVNGNGYVLAAQDMLHGYAGSTPPANVATEGNFIITCRYTGAATPYPTCDIISATKDGKTDIDFYISDEIIDRGQNGQLVGGCVPPAGLGTSGTIPPDYVLNCDPTNNGYNNGASSGQITFQTIIQDDFSDDCPSGDCSLDQGDVVKNEERPTAYVLNNADLSLTTNATTDTTAITNVELTLNRGTSSKDFYALNGNTTLSTPLHVSAGDVITYKLKYDLATSDVEDLYFLDYLPLPVLDVDDPKADGSAANWPAKVTTTCATGTAPAAGGICFSSADTFYAYSSVQPDVSINGASNTLKIDYGDFDDPRNQATVVELLFSIAVNTQPFTDGLKLTNQATVHEGSTQGATSDSSAIINFVLDEPILVGKKSVIATDNTSATMDPAISGYIFTPPGSTGKRWTAPATIDSPYLNLSIV